MKARHSTERIILPAPTPWSGRAALLGIALLLLLAVCPWGSYPPRSTLALPFEVPGKVLSENPVPGVALPELPAPRSLPLTGPNPPIGTFYGSVGLGSVPGGVVFDEADHFTYIANSASNSVTILNGTSVVFTVGTPAYPVGGTYDPVTHFVYFANLGANEVTVINGTTIVNTLRVGSQPYAAAYDAATATIYVVNSGSSNVSRIQGSSVLAGSIPVGNTPVAVAYDPANQYMYVANFGSKSVTIISGATVKATIGVGSHPAGVSYDGQNQEVYVTNSLSDNASVISGTSVVTTIVFPYHVFGIAYDPANAYLYIADNATSNVTVVNGTTIIGIIPVGLGPFGVAYDDWNGCVYVSDATSGDATIICAGLLEGPVTATPIGSPQNSTDAGQSVTFNASLYANASWRYVVSSIASPSAGLGCPATPTLNLTGTSGNLQVSCSTKSAGVYHLVLNVTAVGRISAISPIQFTVFAKPTAPLPVGSFGTRSGITSTDIRLSVAFTETPLGGSGIFPTFLWGGFPSFACSGTSGPRPTCAFTNTGTLLIVVSFSDSNGDTATSPALAFTVDSLPAAAFPTTNRTSVDVGQPVGFTTRGVGGSGGYTYHWQGLPAACASSSTPTLSCSPTTPTAPASLAALVSVTDSNGGSSPFVGPVSVVVYSDPVVSDPVATPRLLTAGETFVVSVTVSGGPGNQTLNWSGLPNGCSRLGFTATCRTTTSGTYDVYAIAKDGNDFVVKSNRIQIVVSAAGPGNGPGGANGNNTIFGLDPGAFYAFLGLFALAIVIAAVLVGFRLRQGKLPSSEAPDEPPPYSETSEPLAEEGQGEPPPEESFEEDEAAEASIEPGSEEYPEDLPSEGVEPDTEL